MSVYWVARWQAQLDTLGDHDAALARLVEHIRSEHKMVRSVQTLAVRFGAHPGGGGRIFMEQHDDLAAIDVSGIKEHTPECDAAWGAVYALMVPGTYETAVWRDL